VDDRDAKSGSVGSNIMRPLIREIEQLDVQEYIPATEIFRSRNVAPKMLIADDDPSVVRLLADHCARMGYNVDTSSNGIQVLLKANRVKPDILVVDVNMPEVDGLSVCAHLLDPEKAPLNVIVITGSKDTETIERCESFGAYYARKGPNFWSDLETALAEIHPHMSDKIRQSGKLAPVPAVRGRPRVLLIDDDGDVGKFLSSRLEKCGVDVKYACDAQQGFRMACRDEPSVIVTDYFMPNGDAQYLLTRLRTTTATENIPVVVLRDDNSMNSRCKA
jgi:CheY-like chemotaxis protein